MSKPSSTPTVQPTRRSASVAVSVGVGLLVMVSLAWTLSATPSLERVLETQRALIAEQPRSATAYNDLGNLLVVAERFDDAEVAYRRAIELAPGNAAARFNLGLLLQQIDRMDEAADVYTFLIEADPRHARAQYQLGVIAVDEGRRQRALEHYARAFALDPELTFAEVNPHVIDNELATEALLLASRYLDSSASRVPREYAEADRIAELMLETLAEESAEGQVDVVEGEPGMTADDEKGLPVAPAHRPTGGGARFDDSPDGEEDLARHREDRPVREARSARGDGADVIVGGTPRVITNEDLDTESEVGQVRGGGQQPQRRANARNRNSPIDRTPPRARANRPNRANRGNVRGGNTAVQGGAVQGVPARPRYRPSRRSTASLSLELLPPAGESTGSVSGYGR